MYLLYRVNKFKDRQLNARMDYEELFVINIHEEQQTYTVYLI